MLKINPKEKAINKIKAIDPWNSQGPKYIVIDVSFCIEKTRAAITPIRNTTKNLLINFLQKSIILSLLYILFPKKIYTRR
jgi:hypothetical protein